LNTTRVGPNKPYRWTQEVSPEFLDFSKEDYFQAKEDVAVKLRAEDTGSGILVKGELRTIVTCQCARCLENYAVLVEIDDFYEYFEDFDEYIDLTESIRETILLALPGKGLCDEKCSGICFFCGTNLNESSCDCGENEFPDATEEKSEHQGAWDCLDNLDF
jgi:uncharacterized protein